MNTFRRNGQLREALVVIRRSDSDPSNAVSIPFVGQNPLHEGIPRTRILKRCQVIAILRYDCARIVDKQVASHDLLKGSCTRREAVGAGGSVRPVSRHRNISIDNAAHALFPHAPLRAPGLSLASGNQVGHFIAEETLWPVENVPEEDDLQSLDPCARALSVDEVQSRIVGRKFLFCDPTLQTPKEMF